MFARFFIKTQVPKLMHNSRFSISTILLQLTNLSLCTYITVLMDPEYKELRAKARKKTKEQENLINPIEPLKTLSP